MSDPPPPKPKPGSLRDRIAAFEKSSSSSGPSNPSPPAPRPKPAGFGTWKPKAPSPPSSPSASGSVAGAGTGEGGDLGKSSTGMSVNDAKDSITKGSGSLKDRMAALQNKGAFGAPTPPLVAHKPLSERPKWKPPPQPVVAPSVDEERKEMGEELQKPGVVVGKLTDRKAGISAAVERSLSPPISVKGRESIEDAITLIPDNVDEAAAATGTRKSIDQDSQSKDEAITITTDGQQSGQPQEHSSGEQEQTIDPEDEERQRRARIAARMAKLGGARVGMAPPMFGVSGALGKKPVPTPARRSTLEGKRKSVDEAKEKEKGELDAKDIPLPTSPPLDSATSIDSDLGRSLLSDPLPTPSRKSSLLSPSSSSSLTGSPLTGNESSVASGRGVTTTETPMGTTKVPTSMPMSTVPRRAGPPRKKVVRPVVKEDEGVKEDDKEEEDNGDAPKEKKEQGEIEQELKEQEQGEEERDERRQEINAPEGESTSLLVGRFVELHTPIPIATATTVADTPTDVSTAILVGGVLVASPPSATTFTSSSTEPIPISHIFTSQNSSSTSSSIDADLIPDAGGRRSPPPSLAISPEAGTGITPGQSVAGARMRVLSLDDGSESKSASLSQHVQHDRDQERERSGLGSLSSSETSMGVEEDEELRREEENIKDMRNMLDSMEEVNVQSIPVAIVGGGNEKEKDVHTSVAINEPGHARKEAIEELEEDDKEVEEEEVRKERVAERIAKMGGINPFSMGSRAPPSKKTIKDDDDDDENQVEKQQEEDPNANAHILPTVKRTSVQALSPSLRSLPPAVPPTSRPSYSHGLSSPPRAHGVPPAPPTRVEEQVQVEQEEDEDPREAFDDESDGSDYGDNDALGRGVGEEKMITTANLPRHAHVHPPRRIVPQTPVVMSDQEEEEEEEWQERVKGNEKGENRMDREQDDDSEHTDEEADERMATSQLFVPPPGGRGSGPIVTQFQSNSQSEYHSQHRSNDNQGNDEDGDRSVPIPIPSRSRAHDFSDNDDGDDNDNDNEYGNGNESDHDGRALPVPPPPPPREGRRERMSAHAVPSAGTGELELEQGHGQLPTASPQFAICPPAPPAPEPEEEGESTQPYSAQSPASVPRASSQFAICPPAPPAEEDEFEDVDGYEGKSDNDDGEGDGEGKDEVLDEEEGDPIDPTFHAPSSRQGSYANLRGVAQGQDQDHGQGPTKRTFSPPSSPPPPPASTRPISILGASRSQAASSQSSSSPSPAPPSRETRPMSVSMPPHPPASAHALPVGSTIHVAPVYEIEEDKDKTSDVDSARRQTIAERMAKLGGIKFGAAPPIGIMGVRAPIRSMLGRRESEDVRREDEVTGGTEDYGSRLEDEGQTELERKERGAEEGEAEVEGEENPRELTEEEEERARKERIAAKMAHMGGMRIGMLPPGAMGGFAPRTQSHVLREENLDRRNSLTTAAARESVAMARPPVPPPSRVPPPVESDSEDGVKIEAEAEVDEEDGYEEVLHDERAPVRRYSDNNNKEQLKEEEETPPPLPSRTGRVVERQAPADSYSTSTANTTTSTAAAGAPSRPPVPGGMRPPVPGGMKRSNTMQSQSESEKETSSKATLPSEYVMVDEPDHELHEEGPPPPPPPRPTGRTPERVVPSLPVGSASGTGSGDWELPSIPTSNEGDLDMSWTDAGSEPEPNAEFANPTISVPKPVTDSTSVPKPSPMDRHLTSDDLMSLWGRVGVQVCESATSLHEKAKKHPSTIVGDGSYAGFVRAALEIVPNAYVSPPPSSTSEQTWGYLIYQQTGPTVQKRLSEILPGDIIQFVDARLKGHKGGMGLATYHQHVGNTENGGEVLVGVVGEFEERKRKVRVVHANQHVGGGGAMVDSVSYRLEDVKSGVIKVYRVLDA